MQEHADGDSNDAEPEGPDSTTIEKDLLVHEMIPGSADAVYSVIGLTDATKISSPSVKRRCFVRRLKRARSVPNCRHAQQTSSFLARFFSLGGICLLALSARAAAPENKPAFDDKLWSGMQWREVGPFRGGRALAIAGVA